MKLAVVGDTHGNMQWLCNSVLPYVAESGADRIVQVGDFGYIWPEVQYERNLAKISRHLQRHGLRLYFLPGNHDAHDKLARYTETIAPDEDGFYEIEPGLFFLGRVNAWTWFGKRFAAVGGAVSIDRDWRINVYPRGGRRKPIWWKEEVLSPEEVEAAKGLGEVDVLFSHDAPTSFPYSLKPDLESTMNRQRMSDIAAALRPKLWFHGHYHVRTSYGHRVGPDHVAVVEGLDMDGTSRERNVEFITWEEA